MELILRTGPHFPVVVLMIGQLTQQVPYRRLSNTLIPKEKDRIADGFLLFSGYFSIWTLLQECEKQYVFLGACQLKVPVTTHGLECGRQLQISTRTTWIFFTLTKLQSSFWFPHRWARTWAGYRCVKIWGKAGGISASHFLTKQEPQQLKWPSADTVFPLTKPLPH